MKIIKPSIVIDHKKELTDQQFYYVVQKIINSKLNKRQILYMQKIEDILIEKANMCYSFERITFNKKKNSIVIVFRKDIYCNIRKDIKEINKLFKIKLKLDSYTQSKFHYYVYINIDKLKYKRLSI